MQLHERIKSIRQQKGLSQVQLANLVKVDNSLLCKLESGKTKGSIDTLSKIAEVLGVTVSDLLNDSIPSACEVNQNAKGSQTSPAAYE